MRLMMTTAALSVFIAGVLSQSSAEADDNTQSRPQKIFQVPSESAKQWFVNGAKTAIEHGLHRPFKNLQHR